MFAYIQGKITYKSPTCVYIDIDGLGYEVQISLNTYEKIQSLQECKLHTYLHIKEDAHTLYGFFSEEEKEIFLLLISVSGVGAATTRMILSGMKTTDIQEAIINEDVKTLQGIKGIGAKTAKRIILELKDKLAKNSILSSEPEISSLSSNNHFSQDALNALLALGINKNMANKAIKKVIKSGEEIVDLESFIKKALKNI